MPSLPSRFATPLCAVFDFIDTNTLYKNINHTLTTVENLKKSKLSQIHTFPYSIRKGTAAEKMEGHLDDKIKEERANIIKQISSNKLKEFLRHNIGTNQEVLIEKHPDKKTGLFKGVTRNYINVLLEDGEFNTLKTVKLTEDNIRAF